MRYALSIIGLIVGFFVGPLAGLLASTSAIAADTAGTKIVTTPQIGIRLTVANPCINSRYAEIASCRGQLTQHVIETTQQLQAHTVSGEIDPDSPATSYLVRTTDYY